MSTHTIKGLRQQFKAVGKFHTPPELVAAITNIAKQALGTEPRDVYDPTCGAGDLLTPWGNTPTYGQDIDEEALHDAQTKLPNFTGVHGDTLKTPAFMDKRFHLIVANPPFSIAWEPNMDERFEEAPTIPTKSKADYAFILHILHLLAEDGVAVVMGFPGILYRGGREAKIREWLLQQHLISHVFRFPGNQFTDTSIETCVLVIKKARTNLDVQFVDMEHNLERMVAPKEIAEHDYMLSVSTYVQPPQPEKEPIDPLVLNQEIRDSVCSRLVKAIANDKHVCNHEGWDHTPFLDQLIDTINHTRKDTPHGT